MRKKYTIAIFFLVLIQSCSIDDNLIEYEEKLAVFASITAGYPAIDTIYVSRSANINENLNTSELAIDNASVKIFRESDNKELNFYSLGQGKYFPIDISQSNIDSIFSYWSEYIISPGEFYTLVVSTDEDSLSATTLVPQDIEINTSEILTDYICPDGTIEYIEPVNVNNLQDLTYEDIILLYQDPVGYIMNNNIPIDTVTYKIGDCYTKSWASAPLLAVDFNKDEHNVVQVISTSLEPEIVGLEPYADENKNGFYDDSEPFEDRNRNGFRDSCYINLIYSQERGFFEDDSLDYNYISNIWKEPFKRGVPDGTWRENSPYRTTPYVFNSVLSPSPIMWLYFDYYGYHLITYRSTSDDYYEYFKGQIPIPNIWLLPNSNIDGGLGVFYSSNSTSFIVKVDPQ